MKFILRPAFVRIMKSTYFDNTAASKRKNSANFTIFFMRLLGLWYPTNKNDKPISKVLLSFWLSTILSAAFDQILELYFKRNNFATLSFVVPCAVLVFSEMTKFSVFIFKRGKVNNLNECMDRNFWQRQYSKEEMKVIDKCEKLCYKATICYLIVILGTASQYIVRPVIETLLSDSMGKNTSDRKLPFEIHLTRLVYESPYYQLTYIWQSICTLGVDLSAMNFACYLFVMNLYTAAQFRILGMRLCAVCDFADDRDVGHQVKALEKLKECVIEHQKLISFTDQVEGIFRYVMLGQIFVSVSLISFCGLQLLLSGWRVLELSLMSMSFLAGSFGQLYLYCYAADEIYASSESISRVLYFMKWYRITDPKVRKEFAQIFRIINLRASRPCVLTAGKFYPLTLECFSAVTKTSMSSFTVLRQIIQ